MNLLLIVLSLAPLGTDTKTHTGFIVSKGAAISFCLQVFLLVWGALGEILMYIACSKVSLEFSYFQGGLHMIVAVGYPLADASYRAHQP